MIGENNLHNAKASHSTDQMDPRKVSRVHDCFTWPMSARPEEPEAEKLGRTILQLLGLTALRAADGLDEIPALVRLQTPNDLWGPILIMHHLAAHHALVRFTVSLDDRHRLRVVGGSGGDGNACPQSD